MLEFIFVVFGIPLTVGIALIFFISRSTSGKKRSVEAMLNSPSKANFNATQKVTCSYGLSCIAVDEAKKKVCLIWNGRGEMKKDIIDYQDVLSSEIYEDGQTVTKTSRGSQIGGALIGGLALGGVGAIIGGLSGKSVSSGKVNQIALRLTVNNTKTPVLDVHFLGGLAGCAKGGFVYNVAMQQARHWHGLMEVLIKQADLEDIAEEKKISRDASQALAKNSVADELMKLAELKKQGLLSDDEFTKQKQNLLGG